MPPTSRTLFLSSCAVPIIFRPSITRCLFKETGRTIPSFLLFYPPRFIFFPPFIFTAIPSLLLKEPFAISPLHFAPILYSAIRFVYRMSNIRGNRILSVSLATFPWHSFAMRRFREVNFSYGRPSLSASNYLRRGWNSYTFRRTLCNTLYSRDELGGREEEREGRLASTIDVLSLSASSSYAGLLLWTVFVSRLSVWLKFTRSA